MGNFNSVPPLFIIIIEGIPSAQASRARGSLLTVHENFFECWAYQRQHNEPRDTGPDDISHPMLMPRVPRSDLCSNMMHRGCIKYRDQDDGNRQQGKYEQ